MWPSLYFWHKRHPIGSYWQQICLCMEADRLLLSHKNSTEIADRTGGTTTARSWLATTHSSCVCGKERGALWSTEPEEWTSLADSVEMGVDGLDNPEEDSTIGSSPVEEPEEYPKPLSHIGQGLLLAGPAFFCIVFLERYIEKSLHLLSLQCGRWIPSSLNSWLQNGQGVIGCVEDISPNR